MLELLGQASDINIIQKHIKKLFPGINALNIETTSKGKAIQAIFSSEGEQINLSRSAEISGNIEHWLANLVAAITETMKELIQKCCQHNQITLDIIDQYPEQIVCLVQKINFTKSAEKAIASMSLQNLSKTIKNDIQEFSNGLATTSDKLMKLKLRSLLMDAVHQASIVQQLIDDNVTNANDWNWLQQMKFYIHTSSKAVTMKMVYAEFDYSFEYLGNINHLVDTKLTQKCYLTLSLAMHLGLGGNPFGPAGTGKTECIKSLGSMLGRLVLVFNCSEVSESAQNW